MKTLTSAVLAEVQKAHGTDAWAWLLYLEASKSVSLTEVFRLTSFPQPVVIDGKTYEPFPFVVGASSTDSEGSLPVLEVTLANIGRTLVRRLSTADNLLGKTCALRMVNMAAATSSDWLETTLSVAGATVTRAAISLRLELPSLYDIPFPLDVFYRDRCQWRFGSQECGFVITATSSTTCDKTLTTCVARGVEELNAGRPQLHPRRFGSWPGLPRKVRT